MSDGNRPVPTEAEKETAHNIASLWNFENNLAFKNAIAMALARVRAPLEQEIQELRDELLEERSYDRRGG